MPPRSGGKSGVSNRTRWASGMVGAADAVEPQPEREERPQNMAPILFPAQMLLSPRGDGISTEPALREDASVRDLVFKCRAERTSEPVGDRHAKRGLSPAALCGRKKTG